MSCEELSATKNNCIKATTLWVDSPTSSKKEELSQKIKDRIEKNRQRALLLRNLKLVTHPCSQISNKEHGTEGIKTRGVKVQGKNVIDSGAGFLIEEDEFDDEMCAIAENAPAPILSGLPICKECNKEFKESFLLQKYDYSACDACRDNDGKHSLITKTLAKEEYLLKDHDFDKREPPLKYIVRKNPHNPRWGEMKLYLQLHVEERALEVWGSEEKLMEEKEKRDSMREENKIKNYNKKIKKLRMEVRSSLYDKTAKASHTHEFGQESYNESNDTYSHKCITCGFEDTYEKL